MEKKRLFLDMDGTLAEYRKFIAESQYYQSGYYSSLGVYNNVVDAIKTLIHDHPEIEVYTLSAYPPKASNAVPEKDMWLDNMFPKLDKDKNPIYKLNENGKKIPRLDGDGKQMFDNGKPVYVIDSIIDEKHRIYTLTGRAKQEFISDGVTKNDFLFDDYTFNLDAWEADGKGIKLYNGLNGRNNNWKGPALSYETPPKQLADMLYRIIAKGEIIRDKFSEVQLRNEDDGVTMYISQMKLNNIIKKYFSEYSSVDDFRKRFMVEDWKYIKRLLQDNVKTEKNINPKQFDFEYNSLVKKIKGMTDALVGNFVEFQSRQTEIKAKLVLNNMAHNTYSEMNKLFGLYDENINNWSFLYETTQKDIHEEIDVFFEKYNKLSEQNEKFTANYIMAKNDVQQMVDNVEKTIDLMSVVEEKGYEQIKNSIENNANHRNNNMDDKVGNKEESSVASDVLDER